MVDPSAFLDDFLTHLNADSLGLRLNQSPVVTGQILHGIASHRWLKGPLRVPWAVTLVKGPTASVELMLTNTCPAKWSQVHTSSRLRKLALMQTGRCRIHRSRTEPDP